ncbi:M6 family metalloprotease domain-containing protein [Phytoactinopolyspora alkaliphila]|uniref:M6 family metalloprotease domain-containing protein n=1 Tax=Phytoactinopolyspora alkaliphila TaxID=1783498 RepID=A0A6N9YHG9_9ACTN|nr:M6 family metalloprotease domain-containing protein [Phytoactinopolyspora alkaliphila]NED94402.1 M6 family metalloprotease domain-containing protein [Phytoactinopolyspora alkaliphila]
MTTNGQVAGKARPIGWLLGSGAVAGAMVLSIMGGLGAAAQDVPLADTGGGPIVPVDPQDWVDQADLTWDDYTPVRPAEWNSAETSQGSESQYRTAVILVDFEDQPLLITQDAESHPFGNPQSGWEPVPEEDAAQWYYEYYAVPNEFNGGQTFHGYWMEDSHGRIGVDVEVFGPYTLPGKLHEYGLAGWNRPVGNQPDSLCPAGDECNKNLRADASALWRADTGCESSLCEFDNGFYVTAGHDESATWQEFGEMMFRTPEDVPASFGPPGAEDGPVLNNAGNPITAYAGTRYVPWTSWRSAANHWPNASGGTSTQAESSGGSVFAHEFSHLRGLPDNYNNPFDPSTGRNYTGYWEMMSRGTFNGPGGTHNRWQVPNAGGSGLGPHHMLHFKTSGSGRLGVLDDGEHIELNRSDLAAEGIARLPLKARSSIPDGDLVGLTVHLDDGGFTPGACAERVDDPFWCTPVATNWQRFTMEVVDRVGNDSFTAGHGVLLAQARNSGTPRVWLIDANPEDIDRIDFYRPGNDDEPGGEPVAVSKGDPRQLDDATFHAGTGSDSDYEYVDEYNNLHFYILDTYRDADGTLFYDVAVRNTDGAGGFDRSVAAGEASSYAVGASTALITAPFTNTGVAGEGLFASDVYRLSSSVAGDGWEVTLPYEVTAVEAGDSVSVPVYARAGDGATESATVTITATSESDPDATVTIELELSSADLKVTFAGSSALLDAYHAHGVLSRSEYQRLQAQLTVAERASGRGAAQALDRFVALAQNIDGSGPRTLASAALISLAGDLR